MTTSFFNTTPAPTPPQLDFSGSLDRAVANLPEDVSLKETVLDWFRYRLKTLSEKRVPNGELTDQLFLLCVEALVFYAEDVAAIVAKQRTRTVQTLNPSKVAELHEFFAILPPVEQALDTLWEIGDHLAKGDVASETLAQARLMGADVYWKRSVHRSSSSLIVHFGNFVMELTPALEANEIKSWNPRREKLIAKQGNQRPQRFC
jgi:hypothetical protein